MAGHSDGGIAYENEQLNAGAAEEPLRGARSRPRGRTRRAAGARRRPTLHEVAAAMPGGAAQRVCAKPYYFLCRGAQRAKWSGKRTRILMV